MHFAATTEVRVAGVNVLERYSSPQMRTIWSTQSKLETWREVELAVLDARVRVGEAPQWVAHAAREVRSPSVTEVEAAEANTRHDVVAFLDSWCSTMPDSVSSWIHRGLTSSDIVDTALALQVGAASDLLLRSCDELVRSLAEHALTHRSTRRVGRTHGMHAAPDTWGHRVADLALAADRARARLHRAASEAAIAKVSGPVGTYVHVTPEIERLTAAALGLRPADVATQVVMRDRLSEWVFALALAGSVCECVALEVRHGQRSEVNELAEGFRAGQKGSSAMPHKRNPITSEKICGLARVLRSYVVPVMEDITLWHERDISHSSVERICLPDSAMVTEHMLSSTVSLVDELQVNNEQMKRTLGEAGEMIFSDGAVVALTAAGMRREAAHALVQRATESNATERSFAQQLRADAAEAGVEVEDSVWEGVFEGSTRADLDAVFERVAALLPDGDPRVRRPSNQQ